MGVFQTGTHFLLGLCSVSVRFVDARSVACSRASSPFQLVACLLVLLCACLVAWLFGQLVSQSVIRALTDMGHTTEKPTTTTISNQSYAAAAAAAATAFVSRWMKLEKALLMF